ncbi:formyltransferase family protein [Planctomycetota bacterium]
MNQLRLAVFADKEVGYRTLEFLKRFYAEDLVAVFLSEGSEIRCRVIELGIDRNSIFSNAVLYNKNTINLLQNLRLDYILLAWWPYIIKGQILSIPKKGVLNFHPSFLPYNRGKHYNFWTLVEDTPFGVSIHFVDEEIDSGDIVFQKRVEKNWEDTGESLYQKAQQAMIELFAENYKNLVANKFTRITQNPGTGSFHYAKELEPASKINLNTVYSVKDLLNLLRARVFPPYPSCWLYNKKRKFNVIVKVKQIHQDQLPNDCTQIMLDGNYKAKELLPTCDEEGLTEKCLCFLDSGELYQALLKVFPEEI